MFGTYGTLDSPKSKHCPLSQRQTLSQMRGNCLEVFLRNSKVQDKTLSQPRQLPAWEDRILFISSVNRWHFYDISFWINMGSVKQCQKKKNKMVSMIGRSKGFAKCSVEQVTGRNVAHHPPECALNYPLKFKGMEINLVWFTLRCVFFSPLARSLTDIKV